MIWHIVFLILDVVIVGAVVILYAGAPGFWQRSALAWYGLGFFVLAIGRVYGVAGDEETATQVLNFGRVFIALGVMAAVFRLFYVDQERRCLKSSQHYRL